MHAIAYRVRGQICLEQYVQVEEVEVLAVALTLALLLRRFGSQSLSRQRHRLHAYVEQRERASSMRLDRVDAIRQLVECVWLLNRHLKNLT